MKKSTSTLAVAGTNITSALDILRAELETLKGISDSMYTGSTKVDTGIGTLDISKETEISNLIKLVGTAQTHEEIYNLAAASLGLSTYPAYSLDGNTVENIEKNCKLRISIISCGARKKELEDLLEEGKEFITKDERKAEYFAKIAKLTQ